MWAAEGIRPGSANDGFNEGDNDQVNGRIAIKKSVIRWAASGLALLAVVFAGARYALAGGDPIMQSVSCDASGNADICLTAGSYAGTINVLVNGNPGTPIAVPAGPTCLSVGPYNPGDVLKFIVQVTVGTPQSMTVTCQDASTGGCTGDGRLNANCGSPVAVYCSEDKIDFYLIDANGEGQLVLSLSADDLDDLNPGKEPVLVKKVGDMRVYLLPDGTFKLMAPQSDGKTYYLFWSDCQVFAEGAGF
jgi:hypothetical protein